MREKGRNGLALRKTRICPLLRVSSERIYLSMLPHNTCHPSNPSRRIYESVRLARYTCTTSVVLYDTSGCTRRAPTSWKNVLVMKTGSFLQDRAGHLFWHNQLRNEGIVTFYIHLRSFSLVASGYLCTRIPMEVLENPRVRKSEETPLLWSNVLILRRWYNNSSKCIKSKEALLLLLLNFSVHIFYYIVINPVQFYQTGPNLLGQLVNCGYAGLILLFYHLAGFLGDKYGQYKVIFRSLKMTTILITLHNHQISHPFFIILVIAGVSLGLLGLVGLLVGVAVFKTNIIQFGLSQLFESPREDQLSFIYCYFWSSYCAKFLVEVGLQVAQIMDHKLRLYVLLPLVFLLIIFVGSLLCGLNSKTVRFTQMSPSKFNPYSLLCKVTKFSSQYKVPVHRSAFTYSED